MRAWRHRRLLPTPSAADLEGPVVAPVADDGRPRPRISVMIPTYECADYLRDCLAGVLAQDPGPEVMEIVVVDDRSTDRPEDVVDELGGGRVGFVRNPVNLGPTDNFTACVTRSRGELVHVLHGDDLVGPGFYEEILRLADESPDAGLHVTRTYYIDAEGTAVGVSTPITAGEHEVTRSAAPFSDGTPVQFAGAVMRRSALEASGGFRRGLVHTTDWEMWIRLTSRYGLRSSVQVLASYRMFEGNHTSQLARTAANVADRDRLSATLRHQGIDVDLEVMLATTRRLADTQAEAFAAAGHHEAARVNGAFYRARATPSERIRRVARRARNRLRQQR